MPQLPSCQSFFPCSPPLPLLSVCLSVPRLPPLSLPWDSGSFSTLPSPELFLWVLCALGSPSSQIPTSRPSQHLILF